MKTPGYRRIAVAAASLFLSLICTHGLNAQCSADVSEINFPSYGNSFYLASFNAFCGTSVNIEVIAGPGTPWIHVDVDPVNRYLWITDERNQTGTSRTGYVIINGSYTITVNQDCGIGDPTILGNVSACANTTQTFSTLPHQGSYDLWWDVEGGTILSGQGTTQITVSFGSAFAAQVNLSASTADCGWANSSQAVTISDPLSIVSHPSPLTVIEGHTASLTFQVTNAKWYLWEKWNGTSFSAVEDFLNAGSSYSFTAQPQHNGIAYRCRAQNECSDVSSSPAISNAATITVLPALAITSGPPSAISIYENEGTTLSVSAISNYDAPTYQWQVSTDNSIFSVIPGATSPTYSLTGTAADNGKYYRCMVTNSYKSIPSNTTALTVKILSITSQPGSINAYQDQTIFFSVSAQNATSYQWQVSTDNVNFINIPGATSLTVPITAAIAENGKYYRCVVSNPYKSLTSNPARLTVLLLGIGSHPSNASVYENQTAAFSVIALNALYYQWQVSADNTTFSNIPGATASSYSFSATAANHSLYYRCVASNGAKSIPSNSGRLTVNILSITSHPVNTRVIESQSGSFAITAVNATSYQWQVSTNKINFSNIPGATSPSYAFTASQDNNGKYYRCIASTPYKSVPSNSAYLTVVFDPAYGETYTLTLPDKNYIHTITPKKASTALGVSTFIGGSRKSLEITDQIDYFDGLGRADQSVTANASPGGRDIIQPVVYDNYGREAVKLLSYTRNGNNGVFRSDAETEQHEYYDPLEPGASAFSRTIFDNSPLNRVMKKGAPGNSWQPHEDLLADDHAVKFDYRTNGAGEVYLLEVSSSGECRLNEAHHYPSGELRVTITKDENWTHADNNNHTTAEYTDVRGNVVLKRSYDNESHDTYYVYDDFGNLRFVLSPEAIRQLGNTLPPPEQALILDASLIRDYAFVYRYDHRKRMIEKKVPGADTVYMVYDKRDHLVLSQDGNLRNHKNALGQSQPQWTFSKYDVFSRAVITGIFTSGESRDNLQTAINNSTAWYESPDVNGTGGYTNNAFPVNDIDYLTLTWYDNYSFGIPAELTFNPTERIDDYTDDDGTMNGYCNLAKGQVTGTSIKVLGTSQWFTTVNYFDDRYRIIQTNTQNNKGGTDITSNRYNFTGKQRQSKTTHTKQGGPIHTITRTFVYDHAGRLLETWHKTDDAPAVLLAKNQYDERQRIIYKSLHMLDAQQEQFAYTISRSYNSRGWLTDIDGTSWNKTLFTEHIFYDHANMLTIVDPELHDSIEPQYNGNVAAILWYTAGNGWQSYAFEYDHLNRLTGADYNAVNNDWIPLHGYLPYGFAFPSSSGRNEALRNANEEKQITYDRNGNIQVLNRTGSTGSLMDELTYGYTGNQLRAVTDEEDKTKGFIDGPNADDDYAYDANGNMLTDQNKSLDSILYNHLNLPEKVVKNTGDHITYTYDATGRKLSQTVHIAGGAPSTKTEYLGEFIYENDTLKFVNHEEGRVVMTGTTPEYQYHLKDHLGNIRATFTTDREVDYKSATLEPSNAPAEQGNFLRYEAARRIQSALFDKTNAQSSGYSQRLNGSANEKFGLARSLSVMPGDTVKLEVYAKYVDPNSGNWTQALTAFLAAVAGGTAANGTIVDGAGYGTSTSSFSYGGFLNTAESAGNGPRAYLNWLIFDRNFNFVNGGYQRMSDIAKEYGQDVPHEKLSASIPVYEAGYLYAYLSNEETTPVEVYFDDFSVEHVKSPVLQVDDYYPFGLTFNSQSRENSLRNKYKFQGQEQIDDLGLGWISFKWRNHQPEIGRFFNIDPLADKYVYNSPYAFSENHVTGHVELEGLEKLSINSPIYRDALLSAPVQNSVQAANQAGANMIRVNGGIHALGLGVSGQLGPVKAGASAQIATLNAGATSSGNASLNATLFSAQGGFSTPGGYGANGYLNAGQGSLAYTNGALDGDVSDLNADVNVNLPNIVTNGSGIPTLKPPTPNSLSHKVAGDEDGSMTLSGNSDLVAGVKVVLGNFWVEVEADMSAAHGFVSNMVNAVGNFVGQAATNLMNPQETTLVPQAVRTQLEIDKTQNNYTDGIDP